MLFGSAERVLELRKYNLTHILYNFVRFEDNFVQEMFTKIC